MKSFLKLSLVALWVSLCCSQCSGEDPEAFFNRTFVKNKLPKGAEILNKYINLYPVGDYLVLIKIECSQDEFEKYLVNLGCTKKLNDDETTMGIYSKLNLKWWDPYNPPRKKGVSLIKEKDRISFSAGHTGKIGYLKIGTW